MVAAPIYPPMLQGYLAAILLAETDEEGEPLDGRFSLKDFDPAYVKRANDMLRRFVMKAGVGLVSKYDPQQLGFDLWWAKQHSGFMPKEYRQDREALMGVLKQVGAHIEKIHPTPDGQIQIQ